MKAIIIEDETPAYRRLEKILREIRPDIEIVEVLDSVDDAVNWMNNHQMPDLAFFDIQISDGISFQIFEQVKVTCPVIFTTAFDEYLLKAFKVNSIDYLLKPIKREELEKALGKLEHFRKAFGSQQIDIGAFLKQIDLSETRFKSRFLVKQGERMLSIRAEDVVCFHTKHGVVHIHTVSGKTYLSDFTLDDLMSQLNPKNFYRANRQFIIQAPFISSVERYFKGKLLVEMEVYNEDPIVVSSEKAPSFKQWLDQ